MRIKVVWEEAAIRRHVVVMPMAGDTLIIKNNKPEPGSFRIRIEGFRL